jgi:hypothetical protein
LQRGRSSWGKADTQRGEQKYGSGYGAVMNDIYSFELFIVLLRAGVGVAFHLLFQST